MDAEAQRLRLHFAYWVIILVLIIIAIATDRWTPQSNFTEYLSNAATMTSLVLGLVAIFYSFIANNSLSQSPGNIATVSNDVKESNSRMSSYLELARQSENSANQNATLLRTVSDQVSSNLISLSETLDAMKRQADALHSTVTGIPLRLDQIQTNVTDLAKNLGEKQNVPAEPANAVLPRQFVIRFLESSSLSFNLVTYACVLARQKNKPFLLGDVSTAIDLETMNLYVGGFLACMRAMQLIEIKLLEDSQTVAYNVIGVHPVLEEEAKIYFEGFIDRVYREKPETLLQWRNRMKKVEALFA